MISLSNLLKQRYVINLEAEKRIINADDRFYSEHSGAQLVQGMDGYGEQVPSSEDLLDGFISGLAVEEVVLEPQPTPEEILDEARAEAERILAEAQAEAMRITDEANTQAEMLFERTKLEGYKEGASKLQDELIEKSNELEAKYQAKEQALEEEFGNRFDTLESDIVDVMIRVFNKVFNIQFDNKKQIILHLIKDTLLGIDAGKVFTIRVAETNFKFIESHVADIKEKVGSDVSIDVVNDMTLSDADCVIETATGVYNCGIDMVLSNLEKDIKSLCR